MKSYQVSGLGDVALSPISPRPCGLFRGRGRLSVLLLALCLALMVFAPAFAADGDLDPSFITGPGPYAGVQTIPEIRGQYNYPTSGSPYNGYQLIFGTFWNLTVGGVFNPNPNQCIARLKADNTLDANFQNNMINGEIRSVYIYPPDDPNFPNKILIGGSFNVFKDGQFYTNFARLNADGSLDTTFPHTIWWGGAVNAFVVQGSGDTAKILVAGYSIRVGDEDGPSYHLLRLNYNGSLDDTFTPWAAPGGYINSIRIYPADAPVFANQLGVFCTYPKNPDGTGGYYYMLILDPATPNLAAPVTYIDDLLVDGPVNSMARQSSDGKWVIVGAFKNVYSSTAGWVARNRVARLAYNSGTATWTLDTGYDVGTGPNGPMNGILPMKTTATPDDRMILIGNFTTWNGASHPYIVRLQTTGVLDSFNGTAAGPDDRIMRLNWYTNGTGGVIFGYFHTYNGQPRGGIAALDANGGLNASPYGNIVANAGYGGNVSSLAVQSDGKILVAGDFNGVGGKARGGFARLNPDGSLDTSFKGAVDGRVFSVAVQADGKILLGGQFGQCQGFARTSLARLNPDGSLDTAFNPKLWGYLNSPNQVYQVVPQSDGKIMITGELHTNTPPSYFIAARFFSNGDKDPSFDASGFSISGTDWFTGRRLAQVGDKYLIAGGGDDGAVFAGLGFLIRLDANGILDTTFGPSSGWRANIQTLDGEVDDMLLQPDGKIVLGGFFTHVADGTLTPPARRAIARFSSDGHLDTTFAPDLTAPPDANTVIVSGLAQQPNGKILIQENFLNYTSDIDFQYKGSQVARLNPNGSLDPSFALRSQTGGYFMFSNTCGLLWQPTGKALVGANFTSFNGSPAWSLVRVFAGSSNSGSALLLLLGD
jgi:uncharacterized delta-60 repeat protein